VEPDTQQTVYLFHPFRLDAGERVLWREGKEVPLTRKAAETLLVLVENAGHVVDKEALLARVWPDTYVEESTLAQNILTLRKALGKQATRQEYIGTVPRRGYRFDAPVEKVPAEMAPAAFSAAATRAPASRA